MSLLTTATLIPDSLDELILNKPPMNKNFILGHSCGAFHFQICDASKRLQLFSLCFNLVSFCIMTVFYNVAAKKGLVLNEIPPLLLALMLWELASGLQQTRTRYI